MPMLNGLLDAWKHPGYSGHITTTHSVANAGIPYCTCLGHNSLSDCSLGTYLPKFCFPKIHSCHGRHSDHSLFQCKYYEFSSSSHRVAPRCPWFSFIGYPVFLLIIILCQAQWSPLHSTSQLSNVYWAAIMCQSLLSLIETLPIKNVRWSKDTNC